MPIFVNHAYFFQTFLSEAEIDGLAIILSLPFTFLVWGISTFLGAVITYSFFGFQSTRDGRNILVRGKGSILVGVLGGLVVVAMFPSARPFGKWRPVKLNFLSLI